MKWPSLSIIIPSFNQGAFIERTILSILHQEYAGKVEIIVADGGSRDQTASILEKYPQVSWWSHKDHGLVDAIMQGFAAASGDIWAIQSSDDFYLRDAFRLTMEEFNRAPELGIVSGCDVYLQPDERTFTCSQLDDHIISPRSLLMRRVIPQHCCFFRRDLVNLVGGLREPMHEGAEVDLWYRALHVVSGKFIPHHTAAYQLHDMQRTRTGDKWYESLTWMVESCEADPFYGSIFKLTPQDKRNLYTRWEILQEQRQGRIASSIELIDRLLESIECTDETRSFLMLHGLLPKPPKKIQVTLHPNHRVPDFNWYHRLQRAAAC